MKKSSDVVSVCAAGSGVSVGPIKSAVRFESASATTTDDSAAKCQRAAAPPCKETHGGPDELAPSTVTWASPPLDRGGSGVPLWVSDMVAYLDQPVDVERALRPVTGTVAGCGVAAVSKARGLAASSRSRWARSPMDSSAPGAPRWVSDFVSFFDQPVQVPERMQNLDEFRIPEGVKDFFRMDVCECGDD
uniref:Uncharacterized protein n=1 Tax=Noctiluca scintillans TaxID=2966 RepID=A0A7S1EZN9_NOCSC